MDLYHLMKDGESWHLNRAETNRPLLSFPSRDMAVAQCGESFQGRRVCLKIHRDDGTLEEVRIYPRRQAPFTKAS